MPLDGFLKIGGPEGIKGECKHHRYTDWLNVSQVEWGMGHDAPVNPDGTPGKPIADVRAFTFVHELDRASVRLFEACCTGEHIPEATFVAVQPDFDDQRERLRIVFRDCLVTSVSVASSGPTVSERVEVAFARVDVEARERAI